MGDIRGTASVLQHQGSIAINRGDFTAATSRLEESAALLRAAGDAYGLAIALDYLGVATLRLGDHERAATLHAESLALCRRLDARQGIAAALINLGAVAEVRHDPEGAVAYYEDALAIVRELGDAWNESLTLRRLASPAVARSDAARAGTFLRQSLVLAHQVGDRLGIAECFEVIGDLLAAANRMERAGRLLGAAATLREQMVTPTPNDSRAGRDRVIAQVRVALGEDRFAAASAAGRKLSLEEAIAVASTSVAAPAQPAGREEPAAEAAGLTPREHEVLRLLAGGRSDREIAGRLSISPRTASNHVASILGKLGVDSRAGAAAYAVRFGLG